MLSKSEVKYIQSLRDKKSREVHQQFVAEGPKIVADLVNECPGEIVCIYALDQWVSVNTAFCSQVAVKTVTDAELERISAQKTPQQVLATVKMKPDEFIPFASNRWSLMLDGLQDPGNLGTIIRTADWFGISAIYCTPDCADRYNPKVVQSAMGSVTRVPVCYGPCEEWLAQAKLPVYATLLEGESLLSTKVFEPGIIIIGNEGRGIRPGMLQTGYHAITIPRRGKAESLNAAVATGIVLGWMVG